MDEQERDVPAPAAGTADMIAVPAHWGGYASEEGFQAAVRKEFGALLGHDPDNPNAPGSRLHFRRRGGNPGMVFVSADPLEEPTFPKGHPKFPAMDRHRWTPLRDGVMKGTLNDTARAESEARRAEAAKFQP